MSASAAGVVALLERLTATLLGVALFGERLGVTGWSGAVLLLGALVLLPRPGAGRATAPGSSSCHPWRRS